MTVTLRIVGDPTTDTASTSGVGGVRYLEHASVPTSRVMEVTRGGWRVVGIAVVLGAVGVLAARPVFLLGSAAVATLFLGRQLQFVLALHRTTQDLTVTRDRDRDHIIVEEELTTAVAATLADPVDLAITVTLPTPVPATRSGADNLAIAVGETAATATSRLSFAVAGTYTIPQQRVTVTDAHEWFTHTYATGDDPEIVVEPRRPRNIHVGQGGERFVTAYGDHPSDALGTGLDPAELRAYLPGDPASRIDWRATARLGEAYVREFEAETDRRLFLVLDTRTPMDAGPAGASKLDYLREVALAYVEQSHRDRDPVGYAIVGADGVTDRRRPDAGGGHYETVRHALFDAAPTDTHEPRDRRPATTARVAADRLGTEETAFATRLRPFFTQAAIARRTEDPLFGAVEDAVRTTGGTVWTVILTDDTRPAELTDAVNAGRRGDRQVRVLLAPSCLFDPGGLGDLDAAYDAYRTFEDLRRDLDALARVHAYEVGPGDRLDAVLARARDQIRHRGGS